MTLWDSDGKHSSLQNTCEKHYIHPKRKMPHNGYQRLLSEHANEETGIYATQKHRNTKQSHRSLQFEVISHRMDTYTVK